MKQEGWLGYWGRNRWPVQTKRSDENKKLTGKGPLSYLPKRTYHHGCLQKLTTSRLNEYWLMERMFVVFVRTHLKFIKKLHFFDLLMVTGLEYVSRTITVYRKCCC